MGRSSKNIMAIFLVVGLWGQALWAQMDFSSKLGARTYPKSAALQAEVGYSYVFWGSAGGAENPWYGYLRGFGGPTYSLGYESLALGGEIYPLSFLGLKYIQESTKNTRDLDAYNCADYDCTYDMETKTLEYNLALGYSNYFAGVKIGTKDYKARSDITHIPVIDPEIGLAWTKGSADEVDRLSYFFGWKGMAPWTLIYAHTEYDLKGRPHSTNTDYVLAKREWDKWGLLMGAGFFESELQKHKLSLLIQISWTYAKGPGLM